MLEALSFTLSGIPPVVNRPGMPEMTMLLPSRPPVTATVRGIDDEAADEAGEGAGVIGAANAAVTPAAPMVEVAASEEADEAADERADEAVAGGKTGTAVADPVVKPAAVTAAVGLDETADETGDAAAAACERVGTAAEPVTVDPVAATAVAAGAPATGEAVPPATDVVPPQPATYDAAAAEEVGRASGLTTMELEADVMPAPDPPGDAATSLLLLGEPAPVSPVRGMCANGPMITIRRLSSSPLPSADVSCDEEGDSSSLSANTAHAFLP